MTPTWLTIVISVIGLLSTILGILGVTAYISERAKHKAKKDNEAEDTVEQLKHEAYKNELREIIKEEISPVRDDVASIKHNLSLNTKGTVTILRDDMKKSLDFCKERGYASATDKANWNELYSTYAELGGNHFKEYVDIWKKEMEELPLKKPTRKKLVEKK